MSKKLSKETFYVTIFALYMRYIAFKFYSIVKIHTISSIPNFPYINIIHKLFVLYQHTPLKPKNINLFFIVG